MLSVLAEFDL